VKAALKPVADGQLWRRGAFTTNPEADMPGNANTTRLWRLARSRPWIICSKKPLPDETVNGKALRPSPHRPHAWRYGSQWCRRADILSSIIGDTAGQVHGMRRGAGRRVGGLLPPLLIAGNVHRGVLQTLVTIPLAGCHRLAGLQPSRLLLTRSTLANNLTITDV
jgi:hypothetical protein